LSVAAIGMRQEELEKQIQGLPLAQKEADTAVVNAELVLKRAEAAHLHKLNVQNRKLTVAEREASVFDACEKEWQDYHLKKTQAEYQKNRSKAVYAELTSLASRMKAGMESNRAHQMWGQG